jgi:hypothetical protein
LSAGFHAGAHRRCRVSKKGFTSGGGDHSYDVELYTSTSAFANILSFEAPSASLSCNLKQSYNNLISTLIMSLYVSYVCLCILASLRIP